MIYILENDKLKVKISSMGAELQSIRRHDDETEYLWQGDASCMNGRAPNLFPVCGRMVEGKYYYKNATYSIPMHGFARNMEWAVLHQKATAVTMQIQSTPETLAMYPFPFSMEITYTLQDEALSVAMIVHNDGDSPMYFTVGGHPCFCVPLCEGESFEDYVVSFDEPCAPRLVSLSKGFYQNNSTPFPLEDNQHIHLCQELFLRDLFLQDTCGGLTLHNPHGPHSVHLSYPDMKFVGLWHPADCDAPYLCIEPWCGLPATEGGVNHLEEMPTMTQLEPSGIHRAVLTMTFR